MGRQVGKRAVVLGGSIAGLLAARALSEGFSEVLIVDRDRLAGVRAPRRGVPQGRHVHGLLARGHQILEELFPGFTDDLHAAGALTGDLGGNIRWFFHGRKLRPAHTGLVAVAATQPLLESLIRTRVLALDNVTLMDRCEVTGLTTTPDNARVTGVRVLRGATAATANGAAAPRTEIEADLVVDATGRGSRTPVRLTELGYEAPAEDRLKIDVTYTTRFYRLGEVDLFDGDQSINAMFGPATPRGAYFSRMENGLVILTLVGVLGDRPTTDPEGFDEYVRSLPVSDIRDIVQKLEPVDDPVSFRFPASTRHRYEDLTRFPERLLVTGDALCSMNPVYGQGMTVAAQDALVLREYLRKGEIPDPLRFFRDAAEFVNVAWEIASTADLAFPEVEGPRTPEMEMANAFTRQVHAAAARDPEVTRVFMRVAGLVESPETLMTPEMMARITGDGGGDAPDGTTDGAAPAAAPPRAAEHPLA